MNRSTAVAPAPIHICFYSTRCMWSKAFLQEISKTPYTSLFRFICVDPSPTRPPLPDWLKQTPTLVIQGEPEPLVDNEVMNWLSMRKRLDEGKQGHGGNGGPLEPEAYLDNEMGGFADQYSFYGDQAGSLAANMTHSFTLLNGQQAVGSREAGNVPFTGASDNSKMSKKEEAFNKHMDQYLKARDMGMPQPIARQ